MLITRDSLTPIDFDGLKIFDYTAGRDSSSSLAYIHVPPGGRHAEAWSKRSEKYYLVVRGRVRFTLKDDVLDMGAGDFCLVRTGQRFSYTNESGEAAELVLVHTPSFRLEDDVFVEQNG